MKTKFAFYLLVTLALFIAVPISVSAQQRTLPDVIDSVQPKLIKIFGGGGLKRLESWQSGFLISPDGLIVTAWSYVLDSEPTVIFDDGRRRTATLVGYHPQTEIALLRVETNDEDCFNFDDAGIASTGTATLAFSNLYGVATGNEQCSVQTGVVSAVLPLNARRGARKTSYDGPAIIVDATTNNPGAAGGAVTDRSGRLLGMIGRESRSTASELWLNYAIPTQQVSIAVELILAGQSDDSTSPDRMPTEPMTLELMGLVLVPNVVDRTPPFVDQVLGDSAAQSAGIRVDDLIVEIDGKIATSRSELLKHLRVIDRDSAISILLQRDDKFLNVTLKVTGQ